MQSRLYYISFCLVIVTASSLVAVAQVPDSVATQNKLAIDYTRYFFVPLKKAKYIFNYGPDVIRETDTSWNAIVAANMKKPVRLSTADLTLLETLVRSKLDEENARFRENGVRPEYLFTYEKYYRQVVAGITHKDEKIVWMCCFCSLPRNRDLTKDIHLPRDGGTCIFTTKVNLSTMEVYYLDLHDAP